MRSESHATTYKGETDTLLFRLVAGSFVRGNRKPDPEFYEYALNLLKVKPSEVVFLDDIGPNPKAAQKLGITTIRKCPLASPWTCCSFSHIH